MKDVSIRLPSFVLRPFFLGGPAMAVQPQTQTPQKKSLSLRTILLLVFAVILTVFAINNWKPVEVWPLHAQKPLITVIVASFILGALVGWLAHSILAGRAPRRNG
jgi:uncharacterized integral membrane protein